MQAPGFMNRSRGAAEEMENLVVDLQGRPKLRAGYTRVNTGGLSIGTRSGYYRTGEQLVVAHWLGDDDTPQGVKRLYYLPRQASWVQDERGRLMFIVAPNEKPYFIDVKTNRRYNWDNKRFDTMPQGYVWGIGSVAPGVGDLVERRDVNAMRGGKVETLVTFQVVQPPNRSAVYVRLELATDVGDIEIYIDRVVGAGADDRQTNLYAGAIEQGSYLWYWDAHNFHGNPISDEHQYQAVCRIYTREGVSIVATDGEAAGDNNPLSRDRIEVKRRFRIDFDAGALERENLTIQFQQRFVCFTYVNEDFPMESRPSPVYVESVYDVWENSLDRFTFFRALIQDHEFASQVPRWATHAYMYVSDKTVPPDHDYEEAVDARASGMIFRRAAIFNFGDDADGHVVTDGEGNVVLDGEGNALVLGELDAKFELEPQAPVLDSYEHDPPDDSVHTMGAYGVGIWAGGDNRVYFNKIGNLGDQRLYALPSKNALVPHSFPLSKSGQSLIEDVHPAAHESGLLVFKRDAIHIIKGKGVISGLYNPNTAIEVDVDASHVIEGIGTSAPRTVLTVGTAVYFVGSDKKFYQYAQDWRGSTQSRDVGLPIQKYLNEVTDAELPNLVAYLYRNCYHLVTPGRVIVMDMSRKYWTAFSWRLLDAFWSRGGRAAESILYGWTQGRELVELNKGTTDGGAHIGARWRSNPIPMPSESILDGIYAVHTDTTPVAMTCAIDIDNRELPGRVFTPQKSNRFRFGTHAKGSRAQVRLDSGNGFPTLDRIHAEIYPSRR